VQGHACNVRRCRRRFDTVLEHASRVGQLELDALAPHRVKPRERLTSAALRDQCCVIVAQRGVAQQCGMEPPEDFGPVIREVFDQIHVTLQAEFVQQLQRRGPQQLGEPCVKCADLHRTAPAQHALVQCGQLGCEQSGLHLGHAALNQRLDALGVGSLP
jgi:hypothetical protein